MDKYQEKVNQIYHTDSAFGNLLIKLHRADVENKIKQARQDERESLIQRFNEIIKHHKKSKHIADIKLTTWLISLRSELKRKDLEGV